MTLAPVNVFMPNFKQDSTHIICLIFIFRIEDLISIERNLAYHSLSRIAPFVIAAMQGDRRELMHLHGGLDSDFRHYPSTTQFKLFICM